MRTNGTLSYILGDHLGSTSMVTDTAGNVLSQQKYKAWGETRYSSGSMSTKYQYTGQFSDSYINLLDYGSRRYDPELGRFISPDSIVPLASQGVQAYDRYGYANNNPMRYTDPTGHMCSDPDNTENGFCEGSAHVKTKIGNSMVAGNGIQRGNGRPPATRCVRCHVPTSTVTPTPTLIPTGTPTIPPELLSTPTPCLGPRSVCLPTATSSPTPYSGPVITSPVAPAPQLSVNVEFYIDWTEIDGIDFAIDIAGLAGDAATFVPSVPTYEAYVASEIAEGVGLVKSLADLAYGDPTNAFYSQAQTGIERTALLFLGRNDLYQKLVL